MPRAILSALMRSYFEESTGQVWFGRLLCGDLTAIFIASIKLTTLKLLSNVIFLIYYKDF